MADAEIDLSKLVTVAGSASVLHKPGAVRLDDYPKLVFAPTAYGPGIRTEDHGVKVEDIANAFAEMSGNAEIVAERFGTTLEHVADAVRYAAATGYLATADERDPSES